MFGNLFKQSFAIIYGKDNFLQRDGLIELILEQTTYKRYKDAKNKYILGTNITVTNIFDQL